MNVQELLDIIYTYYPRGINTEDLDKHENTPEYQLRRKACEKARNNKQIWFSFKDDLKQILNNFNGAFDDYSVLGSVPSFYALLYVEDLFVSHKISGIDIVISVISPFWTYRYANIDVGYKFTFPEDHEIELALIAEIDVLIKHHFKGYEYLPESLHKKRVKDISSSHKQAPKLTIFDALFID